MSQRAQLDRAVEAIREPGAAVAEIARVPVSARSCIFDTVWDFTDELKHRPRSITDAKLLVKWDKWAFSEPLRRELQRICAVYRLAPGVLSKSKRPPKANSFVSTVSAGLRLLADAIEQRMAPELFGSLSDVTVQDLQIAATRGPPSSLTVRQGLLVMFHPEVESMLGLRLGVTQSDIRTLEFPRNRSKESKCADDGPRILPDQLFGLLSEAASARVKDFLVRSNKRAEDVGEYEYQAPGAIAAVENFPKLFSVYEQWRRAAKGLTFQAHVRTPRYYIERRGVALSDIRNYIDSVNVSAQCLIGMYIGARFSELASLRVGSLTERDGVPCLEGRVYKTKADNNVWDDTWVAIPIVRDAVRALECLAGLKNNEFLMSGTYTAKEAGNSYTSGRMAKRIEAFIAEIDIHGRYHGYKFNAHQFRHSLVRQMVKAKLGFPYISFHLKHLHSRVASLPSDVTLLYGNAGKVLQSEEAGFQIQEAKRELARTIYDPQSTVSGGAAREFDERRKSYFSGMTDEGMTKDEIIEELAALDGAAFVNVGLGYCTGRKRDAETDQEPPCIGSLKCNPSRCGNAIVTKAAHGANWQKVYWDNRTMCQDPRFAWGKRQFEAAMTEAAEVCKRLGVDVNDE